jgi:uncharacterized protein (DUF1810 family)
MASNGNSTRFIEAVNTSYDAVIDAVRAANDRGHRVSTAMIEDAQRSQRETIDLFKRWAEAPLDLLGFYGAVVETVTRAQSRTLEATREWFGEMADAQQESREVLQRIVNANRNVNEAAVEMARGMFTRAGEVVQSAGRASNSSSGSSTGDGRRTAIREAARESSANESN